MNARAALLHGRGPLSQEIHHGTAPKRSSVASSNRVTAARKSLLHAGYKPIPTNGKRPFLNSWQAIEATEAEIDNWARQHPDALNTGVLTATTPAIDIDVLDAAVAEQLQCALWLMIGENGRALVRYGKRPKRAALFQTAEPFDKIATPIFVSPNGDTHRVEVLCNGQQIVAHGTAPRHGHSLRVGGRPTRRSATRRSYRTLSATDPGKLYRQSNGVDARARLDRQIRQTEKRTWQSKWRRSRKKGSAASTRCMAAGRRNGRRRRWPSLPPELANTAKGGRNERLYKAAFRMGTMTARRWIDRDTAVAELSAAFKA